MILSIKAWKMVDLEHAEAVAQGSLLCGTLQGYADLENGRADDGEGILTINVGSLTNLDHDNTELFDRVTQGSFKGAGRIWLDGCTVIQRSPPYWAFCMTEEGCRHDPNPSKPKAIFQVADTKALGHELRKTQPLRWAAWTLDRIRYEKRTITDQEAMENSPHPMIKDPRFAPERELRMLFKPATGFRCDEPVITAPNPAIAAMLTRIG